MKIKGRLITAFLLVIMVPVILIITSVGVIINYQMNSIQQNYDIDSDTFQILTNSMQVLNRVTRGVYNEVKSCSLKEPENMEDMQYLDSLNDELRRRYSFLTIRKNDTYTYIGNPERFEKVKEYLPDYGLYMSETEGGYYVGEKDPFLLKKQDFHFKDGARGSAFIITDVNTMIPQIKSTAIQLIAALVLIIFLTALLLTIWIYQSILRPLTALRVATNKMKNGELDFTITRESDDEIGMLCDDFEEMRKRFKDLIEVRMQYEEDSRELISNISHDLKTPITAIKGYAEGLMDGVADTPQKQERYLKTIYTKASDMSVLVDELSFYSRIDCNTVPYSFANVNLDRYFSDCISDLTLDLELQNIELVYFNYTDNDLEAVIDVEQLKRVISNIIGNSVKYIGKKKGIINVRIKESDMLVIIEIEDNGKGIPRNDLPNIFERFYRTDVSRNSSQGGSGLGLAIARKIIDDHGGKIWADSKEDVGTSIFFTLKKAQKDKPRNEPAGDAEEQGSHVRRFGKIKN